MIKNRKILASPFPLGWTLTVLGEVIGELMKAEQSSLDLPRVSPQTDSPINIIVSEGFIKYWELDKIFGLYPLLSIRIALS